MEVVGSVVSENVAGVGRGWAELNGGNRQDNLYHLACYQLQLDPPICKCHECCQQ